MSLHTRSVERERETEEEEEKKTEEEEEFIRRVDGGTSINSLLGTLYWALVLQGGQDS